MSNVEIGDKVRFRTDPADHGIVFRVKDQEVWVSTWCNTYRAYPVDLFEAVSDEDYQGPPSEGE